MHERDRELLARIAAVNRACGEITIRLLSMHPDEKEYAARLLQVGQAFQHLGSELAERATDLTSMPSTGHASSTAGGWA